MKIPWKLSSWWLLPFLHSMKKLIQTRKLYEEKTPIQRKSIHIKEAAICYFRKTSAQFCTECVISSQADWLDDDIKQHTLLLLPLAAGTRNVMSFYFIDSAVNHNWRFIYIHIHKYTATSFSLSITAVFICTAIHPSITTRTWTKLVGCIQITLYKSIFSSA